MPLLGNSHPLSTLSTKKSAKSSFTILFVKWSDKQDPNLKMGRYFYSFSFHLLLQGVLRHPMTEILIIGTRGPGNTGFYATIIFFRFQLVFWRHSGSNRFFFFFLFFSVEAKRDSCLPCLKVEEIDFCPGHPIPERWLQKFFENYYSNFLFKRPMKVRAP